MAETLVSVQNVVKTYQMGDVKVHALRETTLDVRVGELLVIVGPSGSGKSTLLNIIGGMDRPTDGKVLYGDLDLAQAGDAQLTRYRRREIGFVFQFFNLVATLTALENVQVASEIAADPLDPMKSLELVGLGERADHFPAQLSGGEQQRVSIARAFAKRPRLILCDEPTGALDSGTSREILQLLWQLNQELHTTIVIITHDAVISRLANRVATIRDGAIAHIDVNEEPVRPAELQWT